MTRLRLEIHEQTADDYQLRFFNGSDRVLSRPLPAAEIEDFVQRRLAHYQRGLSLQSLGEELFGWLHGPESALDGCRELHIPTRHGLGDLPWELLYHGQFLCTHANQPFMPVRLAGKTGSAASPQNRPLRVLYMASSPTDVQPVLDYEAEESRILAAIDPANIDLVVEESGTLEGLKKWLVNTPEDNFFDVVHLTGHAGFNAANKPVFVLETDEGHAQEATADDFAELFSEKGIMPRLVFLSGCQTAHADTSLPSFCEALVAAGLPAVLGWAKPVTDSEAACKFSTLHAPKELPLHTPLQFHRR